MVTYIWSFVHDVTALDLLPIETGSFYILARGCLDFARRSSRKKPILSALVPPICTKPDNTQDKQLKLFKY